MKKKSGQYYLEDISRFRTELYGMCILWIMIFHAYTCGVVFPPVASTMFNYGNMGVEIFLFLSAICMYFSFEKEKNLAVFVKKRFLRVGVPLLIICFPYWITYYVQGKITLMGMFSRMTTLNFWLSGDQQIWFVSMLIFLYLIYPYLYYLIFGDGTKSAMAEFWSMVILTGISVLVLFIMGLHAPTVFERVGIGISRIPVFLIGCWAGKYVKQKACFSMLWMVVCAVCVIICFRVLDLNLIHQLARKEWYLLGAIPLCLLMILLFRVCQGTVINKFFAFFGTMSLELYLSHILFKRLYQGDQLMFAFRDGSLKRYLLMLVISVVVAFVASKINTLITRPLKKAMHI